VPFSNWEVCIRKFWVLVLGFVGFRFAQPKLRSVSKLFRILKRRAFGIFGRVNWRGLERPGNGQVGVIPTDGSFVLRGPVVGCYIQKFGNVGEYQESVGKSHGNPELAIVVFRKLCAHPAAKGWGRLANVHGHIIDSSPDNPRPLKNSSCRHSS